MNPFTENSLDLASSIPGKRAAIVLVAASLALFSLAVNAQFVDLDSPRQGSGEPGSFDMEGVSAWFRERFTAAELESYQPEDFRIESHMCGCYDRPEPHYPYLLVFFTTPKGDLVGRLDRRGLDTIITRLAVRHGERYCDLESENECYGSFSDPCDFSDYRYGRQLAPYFPTCKSVDPDSDLTPVHLRIGNR
jgi:hypothetical protein